MERDIGTLLWLYAHTRETYLYYLPAFACILLSLVVLLMRPRFLPKYTPVPLLLIAAALLFGVSISAPDDTWVYFRYTQNFLEHGELVFNLGDRLEGFSSPLYQFALIPLSWLTGAPLFSSLALSLLMLLGIPLVALWILRRSGALTVETAVITCGLLLFGAASMMWARGLWLDYHFAGLFVLLGYALYFLAGPTSKNKVLAGVMLGLAYLARPDTLLFCVGLGASELILLLRKRTELRGGAIRLVLTAGPVVAFVVGYAIFRLAYYHDVAPNTAYLKLHLSLVEPELLMRALKYFWNWLSDPAFIATMALFVGLSWRWQPRRAISTAPSERMNYDDMRNATLVAIGIFVVYWLQIGGDRHPLRYFMMFFPVIVLQVSLRLHAIFSQAPSSQLIAFRASAGALAALCATVLFPKGPNDPPFWPEGIGAGYSMYAVLGLHLKETYPQGTVVGGYAIGTYPYYSQLPFLDGLGLVDRHIARTKPRDLREEGHTNWDPDYMFERRPGLMLPASSADESIGQMAAACLAAGEGSDECIERLVDARTSRFDHDLLLTMLRSGEYRVRTVKFDEALGRRLFNGSLPYNYRPYTAWYLVRRDIFDTPPPVVVRTIPMPTDRVGRIIDCAGAVRGVIGFDPLTDQSRNDSAWKSDYIALLNLLEEQGLDFAQRTAAANDAAKAWESQSSEAQLERAASCRQEFGSHR